MTEKSYNVENVEGISLVNSMYSTSKLSVEINKEDLALFRSMDIDLSRVAKICLNEIAHELRQLILEMDTYEIDRNVFYKAMRKVDFGDAMELGIAKYIIDIAPEKERFKEQERLKQLLEDRQRDKVERWSEEVCSET